MATTKTADKTINVNDFKELLGLTTAMNNLPIREDLCNTAETITLPLTKLQVKYIKPDTVQAGTFQSFIVDSVSKLKLTPTEISSLTYLELRDKVNKLFSNLTPEESSSLFGEMFLVEVDKLLEVIVDCFPEVTNPRILKGTVLDDMVKILFSTVFS